MAARFTSSRSLRQGAAVCAIASSCVALYAYQPSHRPRYEPRNDTASRINPPQFPRLKSREEQLKYLQLSGRPQELQKPSDDSDNIYDLLIIGGGATGTGIALDAVTRGLKVALVERDDFSSGTSSKSTKLVHGGVRYLEKAVKELDYEQYKLVRAALRERKYFLEIAPHLSSTLPILVPAHGWLELPYLWAGTKLYDFLAGSQGLQKSYFLPRCKVAELFPFLDSKRLKGALVYYDGQHDDSRMNVSLALTAALYGATVVNHLEVTGFEKDGKGKLCGARVRNLIPGRELESEFVVRAKGIINATGPFADTVHQLDDVNRSKMVAPSSGVHVVLPDWLGPKNMGLIDPSSDGRVIFLLPWGERLIAGTTDKGSMAVRDPIPVDEDIDWILNEINKLLGQGVSIQRSDVLATWAGIRPLVRDPKATTTEALARSHLITVSESGLLTCAGGKWTTYREMAEDAVDTAIKTFNLKPNGKQTQHCTGGVESNHHDVIQPDRRCQTQHLRLIGAHGYSSTLFVDLIRRFSLEPDIAKHLSHSYGDRAWEVVALSKRVDAKSQRLAPAFPYVDGEVRHAVRNEYARTAADVLARRTRLAFLDVHAALAALPMVIGIMGEELKWSKEEKQTERRKAVQFLRSMGLKEENN